MEAGCDGLEWLSRDLEAVFFVKIQKTKETLPDYFFCCKNELYYNSNLVLAYHYLILSIIQMSVGISSHLQKSESKIH